jgi:ribose transport system ATP-binding protein
MGVPAPAPVLQMLEISKEFPGVRALERVDLDVLPGEVHALLGENGAGKSTLIRILGGIHRRDSGEIRLRGRQVEITSPRQARELGIAIIHQELSQVGPLSVAENLLLGREPRRWRWFVDWKAARNQAQRAMADLGVDVDPRSRVDLLSVAERQALEIARALSQNADILVMDEPTAALTIEETNRLFGIIRDLTARGVAVVYISHRLEEIFRIADRVTVLRDGHHVGTFRRDAIDMDGLIQAMVGRKLTEKFPKEPVPAGRPVLEVRGLSVPGLFWNVSFTVNAGEIVGIAGLVGSGKIEVAHAIFGALPLEAGDIVVEGRQVEIESPADAIAHGIGLVPEDRKTQGLVLGMSLRANVSLPSLERLQVGGFVRRDEERRVVEQRIHRLHIQATGPEQTARTLSGGNQQKVVVAKWLEGGGKVLLLCEPTRGIDVGAKVELYRLMVDLARAGVAQVLISSELPEVLGMSDRILVMHEGEVTGEFSRADATQEAIMASATGRTYRRATGH